MHTHVLMVNVLACAWDALEEGNHNVLKSVDDEDHEQETVHGEEKDLHPVISQDARPAAAVAVLPASAAFAGACSRQPQKEMVPHNEKVCKELRDGVAVEHLEDTREHSGGALSRILPLLGARRGRK